MELAPNEKLNLIWVNGDPEVARMMVLMYMGVIMERGYWDQAKLVVWGPAAKTLAAQTDLQEIIASGVEVTACKHCTDLYGISEIIEGIGVHLEFTGVALTESLKEGERVLTI